MFHQTLYPRNVQQKPLSHVRNGAKILSLLARSLEALSTDRVPFPCNLQWIFLTNRLYNRPRSHPPHHASSPRLKAAATVNDQTENIRHMT